MLISDAVCYAEMRVPFAVGCISLSVFIIAKMCRFAKIQRIIIYNSGRVNVHSHSSFQATEFSQKERIF